MIRNAKLQTRRSHCVVGRSTFFLSRCLVSRRLDVLDVGSDSSFERDLELIVSAAVPLRLPPLARNDILTRLRTDLRMAFIYWLLVFVFVWLCLSQRHSSRATSQLRANANKHRHSYMQHCKTCCFFCLICCCCYFARDGNRHARFNSPRY
jgi:hypothetical protein